MNLEPAPMKTRGDQIPLQLLDDYKDDQHLDDEKKIRGGGDQNRR